MVFLEIPKMYTVYNWNQEALFPICWLPFQIVVVPGLLFSIWSWDLLWNTATFLWHLCFCCLSESQGTLGGECFSPVATCNRHVGEVCHYSNSILNIFPPGQCNFWKIYETWKKGWEMMGACMWRGRESSWLLQTSIQHPCPSSQSQLGSQR